MIFVREGSWTMQKLRPFVGFGGLGLIAIIAVGCAEPDGGRDVKSRGVGNTEPDPGEDPYENGGDDTASGGEIEILPDRPAFYGADGVVELTGRVRAPQAVESLSANGEPVVVSKDDDGDGYSPFSVVVDLGEDPWAIVSLVGRPTDGGADVVVTVQAAAAEPGAAVVQGSLQTGVGAAGLVSLAAPLPGLIAAQDLGPGEGTELAGVWCDGCPPELECEEIWETVVSTGEWSVSALASLNTAGGEVEVELAGTTVSWGVHHYGMVAEGVPGQLTATLSGAEAAAACELYGLDVSLGDAHAWSVAWDGVSPTCITDTELASMVEPTFAAKVPPALESAVCAWSAWAEAALRNEVEGASLEGIGAADASGLYVGWGASLARSPSWVALSSGFAAPDTIEHGLDDALLGALFTQGLVELFPVSKSWSDASGGPTITVDLLGLGEDVAALTAAGEVDDLLLPPVQYQITVNDEACEVGHLIPSPGTLDNAVREQRVPIDVVALDLGVAGSDTAESCGLGAARDAYLAAALASALYGVPGPIWGAGTGMADAGAILELSVMNGTFHVAVTP